MILTLEGTADMILTLEGTADMILTALGRKWNFYK